MENYSLYATEKNEGGRIKLTVQEAVEHVRKYGALKVSTKATAEAIVNRAEKEGYNYSQVKQGFSFLITE